MRSTSVVVSDLKQEILGYLRRENERATQAFSVSERDSVIHKESAARLHQIGTIIFVVDGLFHQAEKVIEKDRQKEEAEQREREEIDSLPD